MGARIAVLTDNERRLCASEQATMINVFEKRKYWQRTEQIALPNRINWKQIEKASGLTPSDIRQTLHGVITQLGDCRVVVGLEIKGIVYQVFNRAGFAIFHITCLDESVLDGITEDITSIGTEHEISRISTAPIETEQPGMYFFDLARLQEECPEISSKQALKAFIENTLFIQLELICKHTPPWLQTVRVELQETLCANGLVQCVIRPPSSNR